MVNSIILSGMAWASSLKDAIASHLKDEGGQDMIEYAVIVGAIAVAAAAIFFAPIDFGAFRNKMTACINFESSCGSF